MGAFESRANTPAFSDWLLGEGDRSWEISWERGLVIWDLEDTHEEDREMGLCKAPHRTIFKELDGKRGWSKKVGREVPVIKETSCYGYSLKWLNIKTPVQASTSEKRVVFVWSLFAVMVVCRVTQEFCVEGVSKFSQKGIANHDTQTRGIDNKK